jgi:adenosine deaminase
MTATALTLDAIKAAPKVLLHDHLDGGLRPTTVIELADAIGHRLPSTDPAALHHYFIAGAEAKDLLQYLDTFQHTLAVMQTAEMIERVAYECAIDLANDGVVYAEVRFAPELHVVNGLKLDAIVDAVLAGFRRGEADAAAAGRSIVVNAILCAMRTEHRSLEIAKLAVRARLRDPKVVGFDLAGAETGFPPSLHADALALARRELMNITLHASEPPDLELISDALGHGAHRIGHGVRLHSDIAWHADGTPAAIGPVARQILDRQIPLEMAPTCHVQIGAVGSLAEHPFDRFRRMGIVVTVNTDNRLMSNVSVSSELHALAATFSWGWRELAQVVTDGMVSAFAPYEERQRLLRDVIAPAYAALVAG